jgi:hypothetical protein
MDHAVALVQAYLQLNGYFTSAEYPIMAAAGRNGFRTLTDIDILAFRFPSNVPIALPSGEGLQAAAGPTPPAAQRGRPTTPVGAGNGDRDPGLAIPEDQIDLVIGEVKEGRVGINSGARDPEVLKAVIARFGQTADLDHLVDELLQKGCVRMPGSYQVRLIAFGAFPPGSAVPPCRIISLGHVLQYLQAYVRKHWAMLRHCQFKDPAIGFLMTLEKARRGGAGRRGEHGVEVVTTDERVARPRPESGPHASRPPHGRRRP